MASKPNTPGWFDAAYKMDCELCRSAYLSANQLPNGRMRKKRVPYHTPTAALALRRAYNEMDETETKRIMHLIRCGCESLI